MLGKEYQSLNNADARVKTTISPKTQETEWGCFGFLNFFKKKPKPATLDAQYDQALIDSEPSRIVSGIKKP